MHIYSCFSILSAVMEIPQVISATGLVLDIVGAILVAVEVVRKNSEPSTIDIGGAGTWNGGFIPAKNPKYEQREKGKQKIMACGLALLFVGFALQICGTLMPVWQQLWVIIEGAS